MSERSGADLLLNLSTRRRMLSGIGVALGALAVGSSATGQTQQKMPETQSAGLAGLLTYLHQEIPIQAKPQRIYQVLLDSKQFAQFTGLGAEIDARAGGAFSMFGGLIVGRNIELVTGQRIVQAWRPANWDPGVYSIVKFELKEHGSGAIVVLDHTGFPEGDFAHLDPGWYERYWEPLKKYLA
jgi:activator of HSP90 ATPase